jgi:hypothetical protein
MRERQQVVGVVIVAIALIAMAAAGIWFLGQQVVGPILIENRSDTAYLAQVGGIRNGSAIWETVALPANSRTTIGDIDHEASVSVSDVEILRLDCGGIASYEVDTDMEGGRIVITPGPRVERTPGGRPPEGETARLVAQCPHP